MIHKIRNSQNEHGKAEALKSQAMVEDHRWTSVSLKTQVQQHRTEDLTKLTVSY
jgi:hypothetical protein